MNPETKETPPSQEPVDPHMPHGDGSSVHEMVVMRHGEELICEIKRHPIGIITIYAWSIIGLIAAGAFLVFLVPSLAPQQADPRQMQLFSVGILGLLVLVMALVLFIATDVYWRNRWIVTSDSITAVRQIGLFTNETGQLSMANIEDVTADRRGILQTIFNYGTLKVETAGERSNFYFIYCPTPKTYARYILGAREQYMDENHARLERTGRV